MSPPERRDPAAGNNGVNVNAAAKRLDPSTVPPSADLTTIITLADAERLTTRIQLRLAMIADSTEEVVSLIGQAKNNNVHLALGYPSWTAYVADKFGGSLARLTKAERIPVVELLSGQGMSTRTVAAIIGVSQPQVVRDRQVIPAVSPEIRAGVSETPEPTPRFDLDKLVANGIAATRNVTVTPVVTGRDGKSYSAGPVARAPRTDVVQAINLTILKVEQASAEAGKVRREHLRDRKNEAAVWSRRLESALTDVSVLLAALRDASSMKNVTGIDGKPTRRSIIKVANIRRIVDKLSGYQTAFEAITEIDPKLTDEEATRITGDLSKSIAALQGLNRLIKEVATKPGDVR